MANLTIINPWFFNFFKEIANWEGYKLGDLFLENGRGYISFNRNDGGSYSPSSTCLYEKEIDLNKVSHSNKFYWIYKTKTVVNPKAKPKHWWNRIGYLSEWIEIYPIANIQIKEDNSAEIWVFGEKFFSNFELFLKNSKSIGENKVTLELRQLNEIIPEDEE